MKKYLFYFVTLTILLNWLSVSPVAAQDETPTQTETPTLQVATPTPQNQVPTPSQVIEAINALRISHGIAPLSVHPVLMQVGQMEAAWADTGDQMNSRSVNGCSRSGIRFQVT